MNNSCCNSSPLMNNCCNARRCCNNTNSCCNNFIPVPGPAGQSATVTVGSTITGAPGTAASVTNSGTNNNAVLNFVIPRGENGNSATVAIGTTTTLPAGSQATVTNTGTASNALLNFGIPAGESNISIDSGNFLSRTIATYTDANSIIALPITLNSNGVTINNNVISIPRTGRYLINYGIKSTTIGNIVGIYINGINNTNTNINTIISDLNPSASIILNLNQNDVITLGAVNANETLPLTLENNTINAYITILGIN